VTKLGTRRVACATLIAVLCALDGTARAQISARDQTCITTFNKSIRSVTRAESTIVKKCLLDFAAGRLLNTTLDDCVRADATGALSRAVQKASAKIGQKCASTPPFGTSPVDSALLRAALSQIQTMYGAFGRDLNAAMIPNTTDAKCQAQVGTSLLKCEDRRLREFLKCQKFNLHVGEITDAATLAAKCLGTGGNPQPDPLGQIANDCSTKIGSLVTRRCGSTDLTRAFAPCDTSNPTAATDCLKRQSACRLCLLLNDADGLARDCDLFDDGNGTNGTCGSKCGDGVLQDEEFCDDGNTNDGDGCSSHCTVEGGYVCTGQPSTCTSKCGNGVLDAGEGCDDSNHSNGDGCSSACQVETGYACTGQPSTCTRICGNGVLDAGEACDDHNHNNGDGCSSTCQIEPGYNCSGTPSVCTFVCGNGVINTGETCDDHNAVSGDGCSSTCQIETGWACLGVPSVCTPICGDGLKRGGEGCDDGNVNSADGCSFNCQVESGFQCTGQPSHCVAVCGDGFLRGLENCDDHNTVSGDGCSGTLCRVEPGFSCSGQPSVCVPNCGNGQLDGQEQCDDGNHNNGDGCNANCQTEAGYFCAGQPSQCVPTCGNGVIDGQEQCDDGNLLSGDGCSSGCRIEAGWVCPTPGQMCNQFSVAIDSPANGFFTTAASVVVTGHYFGLPAGQFTLTVNGVPASTVNTVNQTFSHTVTLSQTAIFNPIRVTLTNTANGDSVSDRVVVIAGPSVANGTNSPQSVAMRINNSGLHAIEPLVASLSGDQLNFAALLPVGTVLVDQCFVSVIGCWGSATVKIANPPPSIQGFGITMNSVINSVYGDIKITGIRIDLDIVGSGVVPSCGLRLTANALDLTGNYSLQPLASDPSNIDVNLITDLGVNFTGFNRSFTYGLCDAPVIGDIIQAVIPDIQSLAVNAIHDFLKDPDGAGPQKSPIAQAIQDVLAGINITGPVGQGLGLMVQSPLFGITEDNVGITLGSSIKFTVSVGNGPGQCIPPAGAPVLSASYSRASTFPSFGANTPAQNKPYGFALCINASGFNQMLRAQTECGLMRASLDSVDLGTGTVPITSGLLSLIIPEFAQLGANTPLRIDIAPTLAPIVTGDPGPGGELTGLKIAQVMMSIVDPANNHVWLRGALDGNLGMNLTFDGTGLAVSITAPQQSSISIAIIDNPLHANSAQVETVLPALVQPLIPQLAGALSGFPLPQFFGLTLQGVEVSRNGQFMSLFANLTATP
jgi:cysteine-rich repeat protein